MSIQDYLQHYEILWHTDTDGEKISIHRTNESHVVVNNTFLLDEIPDILNRVQITGMYEIIDDSAITSALYFRVDYNTGLVTVYSSLEGNTIVVASYYGRGLIKSYADRVILKDESNLYIANNVEDFATDIYTRVNNIITQNPQPSEVVDARVDSSIPATPVTYATLKARLDNFKVEYNEHLVEYVSVTKYGAKCDYNPVTGIGTDDTVAIQAAFNAITSGQVLFIPGFCLTSAPLTMPRSVFLNLQGKGYGSGIFNNTTDIFTVDCEWWVHLSNLRFETGASAGHVWAMSPKIVSASYAGITDSMFDNLYINVQNPAKSVISSNNQGALYIDNIWLNFDIRQTITHTAHTFDFREAGGCVGANKWLRGRITNGTVHPFYFESLSTTSYLYDNSIESINFEIVKGGMVKGIGVNGLILNELWMYDCPSVDDHMISLNKVSGGVLSRSINIKNIFRRNSTLNTNIYDINFATGGVALATIENTTSGSSSGYKINLGTASAVTLLGQSTNTTIDNPSATTTVIHGGGVAIGVPYDATKSSSLLLGGGISFPATQTASADPNTLDDYEENTWTPVIRGSSTAGTYELDAATYATYTKIGRHVDLHGYITLASSITAGGSGTLYITGVPFAKAANTYPIGSVFLHGVDYTANASLSMAFSAITASSTLRIAETNDNAAGTYVGIAGVAAGDVIAFSISYEV